MWLECWEGYGVSHRERSFQVDNKRGNESRPGAIWFSWKTSFKDRKKARKTEKEKKRVSVCELCHIL